MTTENIITELPTVKDTSRPGCLEQVGWFMSGAILPLGSLSYYRRSAQKSVGSAILFFVIFTVAISTLSSIKIAADIFSVIGSIKEAYANGEIPEITISQGIAEVNGPQPNILVNQQSRGNSVFVAVDTTGEIKEIDDDLYTQGFLLTRTKLHVLSPQNGYQVLPLTEINTMFDSDEVKINAETVSQAWASMAVILTVVVFVFLVLWSTVVRLMIISLIALVLWGVVTLIKPNTGFGPIIVTGLYAIVPAIYLSHILNRSEMSFPGLQTFLLVIFWCLGLLASLVDHPIFREDRSPRLWTALLGVPLLLLYIVDLFWQFPVPYDVIVLWAMTFLTIFVLIGLRLYFRIQDHKPVQQPVQEKAVSEEVKSSPGDH